MKTFNYLTIFSLVATVFSITVFATLFPVDLRSKKTKNLFVSVYMPDNFKPKYGPKRIAYSGMVGVDSVQSLDKAFSKENYSINSAKNGEVLVPRFYLTQLPKSFFNNPRSSRVVRIYKMTSQTLAVQTESWRLNVTFKIRESA